VKLTLIRHGSTEWNASRRFQGRTDVPLSAEGRQQAHAIAAALRGERIDRIYTSDLSRAVETARIVADSVAAEVVVDRRLREFDFGRWEGLTWEEIVVNDPQVAAAGSKVAKRYAPEGGETFEVVCGRIRSFLEELEARDGDTSIAVVTHAGALHAALAVLGFASVAFAPGGITRITMKDRAAELITLNDLEHLDHD
jgi:broad specificity phosphatase PhoE